MLVACALMMLCQCIYFIGLYWLITRWAERKQRDIERRVDAVIKDWTTPEAEGQPHKFARLVYSIGETVGQAAARSLSAQVKADASHTARVANGIADNLEAQSNPILSMVSGTARGKGAAMRRLTELLLPMLAGAAQPKPNNGNGQSVASRLGRQ